MNLSIMFGIINHLQEKGTARADDLAEKFEISPRSIYRYVDQMSMEGVPIYTQIGRNGGIYMEERYIVDKTFLTKDEMDYLLNLLKENGSSPAQKIKNKLELL